MSVRVPLFVHDPNDCIKRSVPSQDEPRAQRRRAFGFLAAAASLYRLPRPWKTMATHVTAAASASSRGDGKNLGIQDVALRQLGRVGVGQIASSMVRSPEHGS